MKYDLSQINTLSKDEYLQFLIECYFIHYKDKNILLGVFDTQKRKIFSTELAKKVFHYSDDDVLGLSLNEQSVLNRFPIVLEMKNKIFDLVLSKRESATGIVFHKLNGVFGALHSRFDPIFKEAEVCGIVSRCYDFTKLWFGAEKFVQTSDTKQSKMIYGSDLSILSNRQQQILFLLLIGFTQENIAQSLDRTRGTIIKTIANICKRLNLEYSSSYYLLMVIDRQSALKYLALPDIKFKSIAFIFPHDFEMWVLQSNLLYNVENSLLPPE